MTSNSNQPSSKKDEELTTSSYIWKIDNFSTLDSRKSLSYLKRLDDNFYLRIVPNEEMKSLPSVSYSAVYLMRYPPFKVEIEVLYRISILDSAQNPCLTNEFRATYNSVSKNRPVHCGLYLIDRDYIIDKANGWLQKDSLTICCEIRELNGIQVQSDSADNNCNSQSCVKLSEDLHFLLESGTQFSDVLFVIGDDKTKRKEFRLHKNILASRSAVFSAMLTVDCEEKRKNRVEISDMSVPVFEEMIRYIYTGRVGEGLEQYAEELFVAADKYQLDLLKSIASHELSSKLIPDSVPSVLLLADMHSDEQLKKSCIKYISVHCDEVICTEGWKRFVEPRADLMANLYRDLVITVPKGK